MKFHPTPLAGAFVVEMEPMGDERGFFARSFCRETFLRQGIDVSFAQCNFSVNFRSGIVRGLHYQIAPYQEQKLVFCVHGAIFDVIIDLRTESPTFGKHFTVELSHANRNMIYIPAGFAHGYQSLQAGSYVYYHMSAAYQPQAARGLRWDDPALAIPWPLPPSIMMERDRNFPGLREAFPEKG